MVSDADILKIAKAACWFYEALAIRVPKDFDAFVSNYIRHTPDNIQLLRHGYDEEGEPINYEHISLTYDEENKLWDDIVVKIKEELNKST